MGQITSVRAVLVLLSAVAWSFSVGIAHAATPAQIDEARAKGLGWLYVNHKGDGSWSANDALKIQSTASTLEALRNAGVKSGQAYSAAVAWLSNAEPLSTDALSRKIMALNQAGLDTAAMTQSLIGRRLMSDRQVWGGYSQHDMTLPDTALGLAAIRQTSYTYTDSITQQNHLYWSVYCEILPAQRTDGGWSYVKLPASVPANWGESAVISTALILPELKAIQTLKGWDSNAPCGCPVRLSAVRFRRSTPRFSHPFNHPVIFLLSLFHRIRFVLSYSCNPSFISKVFSSFAYSLAERHPGQFG